MDEPIVEIPVAPENFLNLSEKEQETADLSGELARTLNVLWRESYDHRNSIGVTRRMYEASYARQNKYTPCQWASLPNQTIGLYAGVYASIRMSALAHMRGMVKTAIYKPWAMEIDAIPEPAPYIREKAIKLTLEEISEANPLTQDVMRIAEDAIAKRKDYAYSMLLREAEVSLKRAEKLLEDQFQNGGGGLATDLTIENMVDHPSAFVIGCEYASEDKLIFTSASKVKQKRRSFYRYRAINSFNVYPTPDSTSVMDGTGVFVVERMHVNELLDLAAASKSESTKRAVYAAIAKGDTYDWQGRHASSQYSEQGGGTHTGYVDPNGPQAWMAASDIGGSVGTGVSTAELKRSGATRRTVFEVVRFMGRLPQYLLDADDDDRDELEAEPSVKELMSEGERYRTVPMDVFMLAGHVIFAQKINYPNGALPIFSASFRPQQDSFWGQSLYDVLSTLEKEIVATNRQIVFHSGYLTHPKLWLDKSKLGENESLDNILTGAPLLLDYTEPGAQPVGLLGIQNNLSSLQAKLQQLLDQAERDGGFPRYTSGNTDISSAARTTGIMSVLMSNVSKSVELLHSYLARGVIVPMITLQHQINMMYQLDPSIKATLSPVFKGVEGIAEKEAKMNRFEKVMQVTMPMIGAVNPATNEPLLPEDIIEMLKAGFREYAMLTNLVPQNMLATPSRSDLVKQMSEQSGMALDGRNVSTLPQEVGGLPPTEI